MLTPRIDKKGRLRQAYLSWTDASGATATLIFDLVESEEWSRSSEVSQNPVEQGANITDNVRPQNRKCTLKVFATNEPIGSSQWGDATLDPSTVTLPGQPAFTPFDGIIDVQLWDSHLQERILAGSVAGLLGSAIGGAIGGVGGNLAASAFAAGADLANELLAGNLVVVPTATNAGLSPTRGETIQPLTYQFDEDEGDFVLQTIRCIATLHDTAQTIDVIGTKDSCIGIAGSGLGGMAITSFTHVRGMGEGTGASITIGLEQIRIATTTTVTAPAPTQVRGSTPVKKGNQETDELVGAAADAGNAAVQGFVDGQAAITGEGG